MPQHGDTARVDVEALRDLLDGRWAAVRRRARDILRGPEFTPRYGLSVAEHRARVTEQLHALARTDLARYGFDPRYGGGGWAPVVAFQMLSATCR